MKEMPKNQIHLSQICVSAVAGLFAAFLLAPGQALAVPACPSSSGCYASGADFAVGSWRSQTKSSDVEPPSSPFPCNTSESSWCSNDNEVLDFALAATGQSVFVHELHPSHTHPSWEFFEEFGEELGAAGSDISLYANLKKSHETVPELVASIDAVKLLRAARPAYTGVTIDDFNAILADPTKGGLGKGDVQDLYDTARSSPSPIRFEPYMNAEQGFFRFLKGHFLGVTSPGSDNIAEHKLWPDDQIAMTFEFELERPLVGSSRAEAGASPESESVFPGSIRYFRKADVVRLSFLYYDFYDLSSAYAPDRVPWVKILLNGSELAKGIDFSEEGFANSPDVFPQPKCRASPYIKQFSVELPLHKLRERKGSSAGPNVLTIALDVREKTIVDPETGAYTVGGPASVPIAQTGNKLVYFADLKVEHFQFLPLSVKTTDSLELKNYDYVVHRPGGYSEDPVVAGNNDDYYLAESVDGVWLKYANRLQDIEIDTMERFVRAVSDQMHALGKTFHGVQWGQQPNPKLDDETGDVLCAIDEEPWDLNFMSRTLDLYRQYADGLITWRLENALYAPTGGVFAERPAQSDLRQSVYYPGYAQSSRDWYQAYDYSLGLVPSGTYELSYNYRSGFDGIMSLRVYLVDGAAETELWRLPLPDDSTLGSVAKQRFTVTSLSPFLHLRVGLFLDQYKVNVYPSYLVNFELSQVDSPLGPRPLSPSGPAQSGIKKQAVDIYSCITDYYLGFGDMSCP